MMIDEEYRLEAYRGILYDSFLMPKKEFIERIERLYQEYLEEIRQVELE